MFGERTERFVRATAGWVRAKKGLVRPDLRLDAVKSEFTLFQIYG